MSNVSSCARFFSCGWMKFYIVCFQVGCVMLCKDGDNFRALPLEVAGTWALGKNYFLNWAIYYQGSSRWSKILTIRKFQKHQLFQIGLLEFCVEREVESFIHLKYGLKIMELNF